MQISPGLGFFIVNSYQSLLLETEKSVDIVRNDLKDGIDQNKGQILSFSIIASVMMFVYMLSSVYIGKYITDDVYSFSALFFKIDNSDVASV